jgi:hypothetical protein
MIPETELNLMISALSQESMTHCVSISFFGNQSVHICYEALLDIRSILFFVENRIRISSGFCWIQESLLVAPAFSLRSEFFASVKGHTFFNEIYDPLTIRENIVLFIRRFDPNARVFDCHEFVTLDQADLLHLLERTWLNDNLVNGFFSA